MTGGALQIVVAFRPQKEGDVHDVSYTTGEYFLGWRESHGGYVVPLVTLVDTLPDNLAQVLEEKKVRTVDHFLTQKGEEALFTWFPSTDAIGRAFAEHYLVMMGKEWFNSKHHRDLVVHGKEQRGDVSFELTRIGIVRFSDLATVPDK